MTSLQAQQSEPTPDASVATVATLDGVSKIYDVDGEDLLAVDGVDLDARDHEFMALLGASGCGKSTLLGLIAGLITPTSGSVSLIPEAAIKGGTGMVFQDPVLLPWRSVLQNVMLPTEIIGRPDALERAMELIEHVGLSGFERSRPHQLSGGMQQRVSICRSLMTDPRLLLMDEPFGALDAITREQMNLLVQRIWLEARSTVVLVTHNIDEAVFLADRIAVMTPRPGRIFEIVENQLPRPRSAESYRDPLFSEQANHLRDIIGIGRSDA